MNWVLLSAEVLTFVAVLWLIFSRSRKAPRIEKVAVFFSYGALALTFVVCSHVPAGDVIGERDFNNGLFFGLLFFMLSGLVAACTFLPKDEGAANA